METPQVLQRTDRLTGCAAILARIVTQFAACQRRHPDRDSHVADSSLYARDVDVAVYAGHVVLIGVVSSTAQADQFVADAQNVAGVVSVRSYIQLPQ